VQRKSSSVLFNFYSALSTVVTNYVQEIEFWPYDAYIRFERNVTNVHVNIAFQTAL
jgi:hypothetical protein